MRLISFSVDSPMNFIMLSMLDTWTYKFVNILVYQHLRKNKLSLRTAPQLITYFIFQSLASYDKFSILTNDNKKYFLKLKENLLSMKDKFSLIWNQHHFTYSIGASNEFFVRPWFAFNSCYIILIEWIFYCFVMRRV